MSRSRIKNSLHSTVCATVVAIGIAVASAAGAVAAPEDEIARLNRVRANLFEELVKTRAEAAVARAELDAALKGREAAEAELVRLKQGLAGAKPAVPVPSAEAKPEPQKPATAAASSATRRQSARPAAPGATGSIQKTTAAAAPQRVARSGPAQREAVRPSRPAPRQPAAPAAQALPSVLRLQDPQ